jgi:excisionase family DNA binding protein
VGRSYSSGSLTPLPVCKQALRCPFATVFLVHHFRANIGNGDTMVIEDRTQFMVLPSMDAAAAAEIIGVSPRTIPRWAERHEISHFRCGKRLLFSDQDISEFLLKSRISAND